MTRQFRFKNLSEVIDYFADTGVPFTLEASSYSIKVEQDGEKYFFSDTLGGLKPLIYYKKIEKQIQGEIREIPNGINYYDFSGIEKSMPKQSFCVDINSAYLKSLLIENVIDQELFSEINFASKKSKSAKMDRLKAVGLFAKNSLVFQHNGEKIIDITQKTNPYSWVFFTACKKTTEAMKIVKKEMKDDFQMYWVDGIFLKNRPDKAIEILGNLGFESKIEKITNLRKTEKCVFYEKDGKKKFLFLPKTNSMEISEFKNKIKNAIEC
jgi:hypothetical protein